MPYSRLTNRLLSLSLVPMLLSVLAACSSLPGASAFQGEPDVVFQLTAENHEFVKDGEVNPTLTVTEGDRVRVELAVTEGRHDWYIEQFDAFTPFADSGETESITFVANEAGTFDYYCSVSGHRELGMEGLFIVEPS